MVKKNLPANERDAGDLSSIPGWVDSLEKEMATQSSFLPPGESCEKRSYGVAKTQMRLSK